MEFTNFMVVPLFLKNTDNWYRVPIQGGGINFQNFPKVELVGPGLVYAIGTPPALSTQYYIVNISINCRVMYIFILVI